MLKIKECEQIISELKYEKDVRKYPDNHRRGQFKAGWEDVVIRQQTYLQPTLKRLTWCNLGYRLGQRLGEKTVNEINQIFDILAMQYKSLRNIDTLSWQAELEQWVAKHRKIPSSLSDNLISFFELAFTNTRHQDKAWFGIHKQAASLVIGGIYLAAIGLGGSDSGILLLLDRELSVEKIEYKPVKSTQKYTPLIWAHIKEIENIGVLIESSEIWHSYSQASDKILNSPISHARSPKFQQNRHKILLSEFWDSPLDSLYDSSELQDEYQRMKVNGDFDVENSEDARKRVISSIVQRLGQPEFRDKLFRVYGGRCLISGCDVAPAIEAAHIIPYRGPDSNHVTNGLLLRADIHNLFDLYLISVHPETYEIMIAPNLTATCYQEFIGQKLALPRDKLALPNKKALEKHDQEFLSRKK